MIILIMSDNYRAKVKFTNDGRNLWEKQVKENRV